MTPWDATGSILSGTKPLAPGSPLASVASGRAVAETLPSACGCAVHASLDADQAYTTAELKVAYHRGMTKDTGPVRAEGTVITLGRRRAPKGECAIARSDLFDHIHSRHHTAEHCVSPATFRLFRVVQRLIILKVNKKLGRS